MERSDILLELNKIYCMDCLKGLKLLNDECIDLTVTSPPYDDLRKYNGYDWDFEGIVRELYRVTKNGGVVVWIVADAVKNGSETGTSFIQALYFKEVGFNIHDTMIWCKDTFNFPDKTRYGQSFEYMFVFSKGKIKTVNKIKDRKNKWSGTKVHGTSRNSDGTTFRKCNHNKTTVGEFGERFNVWNISSEKNNNTGHPAVFPEQLAKDHILSWSNQSDTVLDPFSGSGTTCKVAKITQRNYIGFEISKEYCDIANNRVFETFEQLELNI